MTAVVVDTSAAVAILTGEPGGEELAEAFGTATPRVMSAATLVELGIVLEARLGPAGNGIVERFLRDGAVDVVAVERDHADRAIEGWRRFGKGHHRAGLNLGDCFTYALAVVTGHPVLCMGGDFAATDVEVIRPPG